MVTETKPWTEYTFADAIDVNPKRNLKKGTMAKAVAMADVNEFVKKIANYEEKEFKGGTKFQNNDTIMARITPCLENGKTAFVDILDGGEVAFGSTEFIVLSRKEGITTPEFVYYTVISPNIRARSIKAMTGTSGRQRVDNDVFNQIKLLIPNITEQDKITDILANLDQKIFINEQINKKLERMGELLFKQWFIDFEFPNEEGRPYKSSGGEMQHSELGEIPKGWDVKSIGNATDTIGGGTPKTTINDYWNGKVYWATPKDITALNSPIIFNTSRKITELGLKKSSAKILPKESLLMTSRATLGFFAITQVPISTNQGFISMPSGSLSTYYLYYLLKGRREEIISLANASTFQEINKTTFRSIKIIIPQAGILNNFHAQASELFNSIFTNDLEITKLSKIRDTLLPKLMSGEVRV